MSKLREMFGEGWYNALGEYLQSPNFRTEIGSGLLTLSKKGVEITPKFTDTFRAFKECPWEKIHTVILGMDPYPGKIDKTTYVADGLAFSSRDSKTCPKSLQFIFNAVNKDIYDNAGYYPENFDLKRWANQGILLLNCALSLPIKEKSGTHIELWRLFITKVLSLINSEKKNIGFILMGQHAKIYSRLLNNSTFAVYSCNHPSSANYNGGKWNHEGVFKALDAYHRTINNIKIDW